MILHYLKTLLHSIQRQKGIMALNFIVLIVSMIVLTILISTFSEFILTPHYDAKGESLYFLENPGNNRFQNYFTTDEKQQLLKIDAPVNWCFMSAFNVSIHPTKNGIEKDFDGRYANENYLKILDLDFIRGERYSKKHIGSGQRIIVISETIANFIFNSVDVIGEEVLVYRAPYKIVGVFKNMSRIAETTSVAFIPDNLINVKSTFKWKWHVAITSKNTDKERLEKTLDKHSSAIFESENGSIELYTKGEHIISRLKRTGLLVVFILLFALALPSLLIANLIMTRMETKLNELGIRKAFGANKKEIFIQLIYENIVFTLIGGIIALFIGQFIVSNMLYEEDNFSLNSILNIPITIHVWVMISFLIFGFLSGFYPSRMISRKTIISSLNHI